MTSIHSNAAAGSAIGILRSISGELATEQGRMSSGYSVETARDNAAYWSISTTMRSDARAMSAVADALALGLAKVDVAYAGLDRTVSLLSDFQAKLVASREGGVDKAKIQTELVQIRDQIRSVADSASFNGENWLSTDIEEIYNPEANFASLVSSFTRDAASRVTINQIDFRLSEVSLYNSQGGGILQKDPRDMETIGGIRVGGALNDYDEPVWSPNSNRGSAAIFGFGFSGPLDFSSAGAQISFDVTVDKDDPTSVVPAPHHPGQQATIVVDRSTVDAVDPSLNGVVSTNKQYAAVLNRALQQAGVGASFFGSYVMRDEETRTYVHDPVSMSFYTREDRSLGTDGSYVEVNNFTSNIGSGGLGDALAWGRRGSDIVLAFEPFTVFKDGDDGGVEVGLNFFLNGSMSDRYRFDRAYVNDLLGKDNGKVETVEEMVTLLKSLLSEDWPDVIIESISPTAVSMRSDPEVDRLSGGRTSIGFSNIAVSIEPLPTTSLDTIDIEARPERLDAYIRYVDRVLQNVIDGATTLGALKTRLETQMDMTQSFMATIDKGVGRLVDNDMTASAARLKALQTQQQLGVQALNIANSRSDQILSLFQ